MAISTELYGPKDRTPDYARGGWQYCHLIGDGSAQCFDGAGEIGDIINNVAVAGTVSFYDVATGGTANAANRLALFDTTALGPLKKSGPFAVSNGLRVVTTAGTNDITFQLRGRAITKPATVPPSGKGGALYS